MRSKVIGLVVGTLAIGVGPVLGAGVATPLGVWRRPVPDRGILQTTTNCAPSPDKPNGAFRRRRLGEGTWHQTVQLGPCVSDDDALRILRAIRDHQILNRQGVSERDSRTARAGHVADIPVIDVSQVSTIQVPDQDLVDTLRRPPHQYVITTVNSPERLEGLELFVNVRDGHVELVGYAFWLF